MSQTVSKCLTMGQQVSKGVMCLHIQVRKLSLLGIAVAGVYCCMGLRSVSIERRSCLLLRSEPSIVSFNWQGSLVIRLYSCHCFNQRLIPKKLHCFDRKKKVMPAVSFASLLPLGDTAIRHELLDFFVFFEIWKVADLNLTDLHPKLRTVNNSKKSLSIYFIRSDLNYQEQNINQPEIKCGRHCARVACRFFERCSHSDRALPDQCDYHHRHWLHTRWHQVTKNLYRPMLSCINCIMYMLVIVSSI